MSQPSTSAVPPTTTTACVASGGAVEATRSPPSAQQHHQRGQHAPEDHGDELERIACERVGEHPEAQPQERRNHAGPPPVAASADQLEEPGLEVALAAHVVHRARDQHATARDDGDVVAHALDEIHRVARDDDGSPALDEPVKDVADVRRRDGVHRLEGLVEHEQARGVHQRRGERDLLRHARRVVGDDASGGVSRGRAAAADRRSAARPGEPGHHRPDGLSLGPCFTTSRRYAPPPADHHRCRTPPR